jgi:hypothetical protein
LKKGKHIQYHVPYHVIIFIIILILILYGVAIYQGEKNYCKAKGFDSLGNNETEKGWIECCNDVFVNHLKVDSTCEVIKYG